MEVASEYLASHDDDRAFKYVLQRIESSGWFTEADDALVAHWERAKTGKEAADLARAIAAAVRVDEFEDSSKLFAQRWNERAATGRKSDK